MEQSNSAAPKMAQQTGTTGRQEQTSIKPLRGRGMFKGKSGGTGALLRQKREDTEREERRF